MDERLKFIARLLDGEKMAAVCRHFHVSRKTGYKILNRYNSCGLEGLTDRSRRPYRHANQLPLQIETLIVRLKQDKPNWGAPKIRERLARLYPDVHTPAISTVHVILDRHGLVKRRTRRRNKAAGTPLSMTDQPNDLWCADYKGEFMLADRRYCYPLTITDFASRYLIACEALHTTKEAYAFSVFESVFKEFGLPRAIRTDNGVPFASPNALFGLSRLVAPRGAYIRRVPAGKYLRCRSFSSNALDDFRGLSTRSWAVLARRLRSANVFRTVSFSVRITLGVSSIGNVGAIVRSRLLPDLHVWSAVQRHLVVAAKKI
jgi:putative transposase